MGTALNKVMMKKYETLKLLLYAYEEKLTFGNSNKMDSFVEVMLPMLNTLETIRKERDIAVTALKDAHIGFMQIASTNQSLSRPPMVSKKMMGECADAFYNKLSEALKQIRGGK